MMSYSDHYLSTVANMRLNSHSTFYGGDPQHCYDFMTMTYNDIDGEAPIVYPSGGKVFLFNGLEKII